MTEPLLDTEEAVREFVRQAHDGQMDKLGVPYVKHVEAVAYGLIPFGNELVIAGLLHDVLEDTKWSAVQLKARGVPVRSLKAVVAVTNNPGVPYADKIDQITRNQDAVLVKIADNAHNSRPDRLNQLPEKTRLRLEKKYRAAREVLWAAAAPEDVRLIVGVVNPALIPGFYAYMGVESGE